MDLRRRLYRPARNVYQRVFNRDHFEERRVRREYFRPFVQPGDLVFDVGAHRGHYAETFRELGARVVAVEPNPAAAAEIIRHFPGITVVQKAVGAAPGTAQLRVGRDDQHSTLSGAWVETHRDRWSHEISVELTTLDEMIAAFGSPAFAKIDVEGYEGAVLRGLTFALPAVAFEFQTALIDDEPFEVLKRLGHYEFAVSTTPYALSEWVTADDARALIEAFASEEPNASGDVFARLRV